MDNLLRLRHAIAVIAQTHARIFFQYCTQYSYSVLRLKKQRILLMEYYADSIALNYFRVRYAVKLHERV